MGLRRNSMRQGLGRVVAFACLLTSLTVITTVVEAAPTYGRYCNSGAPIRSGGTSERVVAFTFDDGPWPVNTNAVMNKFERYGWRATFFMVGVNVRSSPDIARSVVARGHGIAAHSVTHRYGVSTIASEAAPSQAIIESVTGVRTSWFRAPGLTLGSSIDAAVYAAGMCNISTASDLGDWRSPRASASTLCARYRNALKPGAIILLHDGGSHSPTIDALDCMLSYTRQQGYSVVDLGEMLAGTARPSAPPPPPAPPSTACPSLTVGSRGTAVAAAQRAVMNRGIYLRGGADGSYGLYTQAAVALYQSQLGLSATGSVDAATAQAMGLCPSTAPAPPSPPVAWSSVGLGARGATVQAVQRAVIGAGIYLVGGADGIFGVYTESAVKRFQAARGLSATGVVDEATAVAMGVFGGSPATPAAAPWSPIGVGARGTGVQAVQRALSSAGLALVGGADGVFGRYTEAAVKQYQTARNLSPTGIVDEATAIAMGLYTPPAAPPAIAAAVVPAATSPVVPTTEDTTTTTLPSTTAPSATASIGNLVWIDLNGDGHQDPVAEPGLPDVVVRLRSSAGVVGATSTDAAGGYEFAGLPAGTYTLEFVLPPDMTATLPEIGTDDQDSSRVVIEERTAVPEIVALIDVTVDGTAAVSSVDLGVVEDPATAVAAPTPTPEPTPPDPTPTPTPEPTPQPTPTPDTSGAATG